MPVYFLPQSGRKTLSGYYQNVPVEMPDHGDAAWQGWEFPVLPAFQVQEVTRAIRYDTIFWGITGLFSGASEGNTQGLRVMLTQIHNGQDLPLYNKPQMFFNVCGTAAKPGVIKPAFFIPAGDSLMVQVSSLDPVNSLAVEIVLFGNRVPAGWQSSSLVGGGRGLAGMLGDALASAPASSVAPHPYQAMILNAKLSLTGSLQPPNADLIGDVAPPGAQPIVQGPHLQLYPNVGAPPSLLESYQVPPGQRARIFEHAIQHVGGNPPEVSGSGVSWSFFVNGAPLKGLGIQTAQIGAFATPDRVVIFLTENDLFQVFVNPGAIAQAGRSGYRFNGWTVPILAQGSKEI